MPPPKGFKFKTKGSAPAKTKELDYDAITNDKNTASPSDRKRGRPKKDDTSSPSPSSNKKTKTSTTTTTTSSSSSSSKNKKSTVPTSPHSKLITEDPNKTYYPKIDINRKKIKEKLKLKPIGKPSSDSSDGNGSHKVILNKIISEVINIELDGLEKYFKLQQSSGSGSGGKGSGDKEAIHTALKTILSQLETRLTTTCPDDITFQPEIVNSELQEISVLQSTLSSMYEQSDQLSKYSDDIDQLKTDYGLWLSSPPTDVSSGSSSSSSGSGSSVSLKKCLNMISVLSSETSKVSSSLGDFTTILTQASTVQEQLYEAHQSSRLSQLAGSTAPNSPKGLIKGLQKM